MTFLTAQAESTQHVWEIAIGAAVGILAVVGIILFLLRRFLQSTRESHSKGISTAAPRSENTSAFMTASMEGVIRQLRDQEKELERLHKVERERAEHTERLSEEVTRNMPAGLVVVNATGIISSANPAAEQVLGTRGLGFRRYSEVLGEQSELTRFIGECLASGSIFRREQVLHEAPGGESRQLGVTISPIRRGTEKISGAICLITDLTELAALQGVSLPTMSSSISAMAERGWVKRAEPEKDRRTVLIEVTANGRAALERVARCAETHVAEVLAPLDAVSRRRL